MTAPLMVSELDVRKLLGIISDDRSDLPAAGLPRSLLDDLTDVIRCDAVSFAELDSGRQTHGFIQDAPAGSATRAATPTTAATFAASRRSRISIRPGSGTAPACTATLSAGRSSTR
jgi:hypothetical protein